MLDPFMIFKWPLFWIRFWTKRLGARTLVVGTVIVGIAVLLYGWWESWA